MCGPDSLRPCLAACSRRPLLGVLRTHTDGKQYTGAGTKVPIGVHFRTDENPCKAGAAAVGLNQSSYRLPLQGGGSQWPVEGRTCSPPDGVTNVDHGVISLFDKSSSDTSSPSTSEKRNPGLCSLFQAFDRTQQLPMMIPWGPLPSIDRKVLGRAHERGLPGCVGRIGVRSIR